MKRLIYSIVAIAIMATAVTSCKKYEDGPSLSLRTKKARLCGDWKIEKVLYNGGDSTAVFTAFLGANFGFDIEKDGKYKITGASTDDGTWSLGEDKDDVTFKSSQAGSTDDTYRILKLKNKELWWKQTQANGDVIEFHFVPQD